MLERLWNKNKHPQRLVYTHLAKAGGNSVTGFLNSVATEYGLDTLGISGPSRQNACGERLRELLLKHRLHKKNYKIILGHIPFCVSRKLFPSSLFTTTLRTPEWQLVSSYCSQPPHALKPDFGMSDFIDIMEANPHAEWNIDNYQTRMLCDDPCFDKPSSEDMLESAKRNLKEHYLLVGFVEHIKSYFQSLAVMYGVPGADSAAPSRNVTGNYKPYVKPQHLEYARQRNALDIELYRWAIEEFLPRDFSFAMTLPKEKSDSHVNVWLNRSYHA